MSFSYILRISSSIIWCGMSYAWQYIYWAIVCVVLLLVYFVCASCCIFRQIHLPLICELSGWWCVFLLFFAMCVIFSGPIKRATASTQSSVYISCLLLGRYWYLLHLRNSCSCYLKFRFDLSWYYLRVVGSLLFLFITFCCFVLEVKKFRG